MWNKTKVIAKWYWQTAGLVGVPVLFYILSTAFQRGVFTVNCTWRGKTCEYAFGAQDAMATYMSELVEANPNVDIVARPRK